MPTADVGASPPSAREPEPEHLFRKRGNEIVCAISLARDQRRREAGSVGKA